ncbi:serine/threonine-protein kinase [Nonomuraea sp. NPDC050451]|uniref:serine/threonine-protein kinase n=1 Tax=Nonomuraea sp. NPDC050451 TaxID=3364364 RepID=UPI00379257A1
MIDNPPESLLSGRYRLIRALGRGGMGTVWLARDETLDREVAVKEVLLSPDIAAEERAELCERTVREAYAAARLSHPGIATVHDVFSEDDRPWIVMELLRGRTLQDAIRDDGPWAPQRVARLGADLLTALSVAHRQGIQHRDVKPGNVFLCDDGRAVLTDFGIARIDGQVTITQSGLLIGSPGFIAPERLRGERGGPLSDLWSLAATLYTAVEGTSPFHTASPLATLHRVLTEEPPPSAQAGPVLGPVLLRMLSREAADRPDPALAGRWLEAAASGVPAPMDRPRRPRPHFGRAVPVAAAVAGLAVVGTLAWYGVARGTPEQPPPRAAAPPASAAAPPTAALPSKGPSKGRFTVPVDFCTLLTGAQVKETAYGRELKRSHSEDGCAWTKQKVGLSVEPTKAQNKDYWEALPVEAHEEFLNKRTVNGDGSSGGVWQWGDVGMQWPIGTTSTAATSVAGVGEEAFQYDVSDRRSGTMVRSNVVFRVSNMVVEVQYVDFDGTEAARVRSAALRAAKLTAAALSRRG